MWILIALGLAHILLGSVAIVRALGRLRTLMHEHRELRDVESYPVRVMSDFLTTSGKVYLVKSCGILVFGVLIVLGSLPMPWPEPRLVRLTGLALAALVTPLCMNYLIHIEAFADKRKREYYLTEYRKARAQAERREERAEMITGSLERAEAQAEDRFSEKELEQMEVRARVDAAAAQSRREMGEMERRLAARIDERIADVLAAVNSRNG